MVKKLIIPILASILGILAGILLLTYLPNPSKNMTPDALIPVKKTKEVWGFLPYWFLDKAKPDYSGIVTTLNYFSLTVDDDGTIQKSTNPVELEPGYYALTAGKADSYLEKAREKGIKLSLTVFSGDQEAISKLISNPVQSAQNLMTEIPPIMAKYGFSDLNLDIEGVGYANPETQLNYEKFVAEVRRQISAQNLKITLSMDIIPVDFIRADRMANPANLAKYLDKIVLMAYDFHSPSSYVTGPVAPLYGAGSIAEFDTEVAINKALKSYDSDKILLGVPFYGYSWETLNPNPRAAIVPSSALIESNSDMESLLASCATCSAKFDNLARESFVIYKNPDTNTYQQIFYPDVKSIESKIDFVSGNNLGGLAVWALGYEGNSILTPLQSFLSHR